VTGLVIQDIGYDDEHIKKSQMILLENNKPFSPLKSWSWCWSQTQH